MLEKEQTETLRALLEASRAQLLENAEKALGLTMNRDRDNIGHDSIDESTEETMYGTALRLHDRENFLLGKVNAALDRLGNGEIDACEDCEEPIGYARLHARPVTTLCIGCKEESEQKEL